MIINRLSLMKMNERPLSLGILEQIYICMNSPLPSVPNRIEVLDVGHWTDWKSVTTSFVRPLITLTAYGLFSTQHLLHVNTYSFDFRTNLARFCQHPTQKKVRHETWTGPCHRWHMFTRQQLTAHNAFTGIKIPKYGEAVVVCTL